VEGLGMRAGYLGYTIGKTSVLAKSLKPGPAGIASKKLLALFVLFY